MKNVKPKSEFTNIEKSAIHAVKSLVFMKYPSLSKYIAFEEAQTARLLNSTDTEWMHIWLKAKGRINRDYNNFSLPDNEELETAEYLCKMSKSFRHLLNVSDIFAKGFKGTNVNDEDKRNKYFKLSSNALS